jgi:hypothetical protein
MEDYRGMRGRRDEAGGNWNTLHCVSPTTGEVDCFRVTGVGISFQIFGSTVVSMLFVHAAAVQPLLAKSLDAPYVQSLLHGIHENII